MNVDEFRKRLLPLVEEFVGAMPITQGVPFRIQLPADEHGDGQMVIQLSVGFFEDLHEEV